MLAHKPKFYYFAKHTDYSDSTMRKISSSASVISRLFIPWLIYMAVTAIVNEIDNTVISLGASFIAYIILLVIIPKAPGVSKKGSEGVEKGAECYNAKEIACIFEVFLCASAFYFVCYALLGENSPSAEIAITNMILYVGFAVSLEDLVNKEGPQKRWILFVEPFRRLNIRGKHVVLAGLALGLLAVVCFHKWTCIAICVLAFLFLLFVLWLDKYRTQSLRNFGKNMLPVIEKKNVLLLQVGTDYVMKKAITEVAGSDRIEENLRADAVLDTLKCDVVIVLNSMAKKHRCMYLSELRKVKSVLDENGVVIDPFITKRNKRSAARAWLGIPCAVMRWFPAEAYLRMISEEK